MLINNKVIGRIHKNSLADAPKAFWVFSIFFIFLNSFAIYYKHFFLLPIAFLPILIYYSIFEFEKLYYFAVFATPLSIGLQLLFPAVGFNISLPSEIFLLLLLFIIILKSFKGNFFDSRIFSHPISVAIVVYLTWIFITSISSSMPTVSFKFLLAKCWFVFPLYFLPVVIFKDKRKILLFFGLYIVPFVFVILYTISKHIAIGLFDKNASHFVMQPFYNDHTSYGAILAMFIPVLYGMLFLRSIKNRFKIAISVLAVLYTIAIVLSYTRAAWISVLGAGVLLMFILFKIKIRYIAVLALISISLLFIYRIEIIDKLNKNKQDSSAQLSDHVKSIANIATDASNLERINRWNSALAMFKERPILGWGPGTYMFQYAPFQMANEKTIISTNFAEGGNAHSEYIGPLAEEGIFGFLTVVILIFTFFYSGLKLYFKSKDFDVKLLVLICLLSVFTYVIHGTLNNYLDTDKASVPFWGFLAIICALDIYALNKNPQPGGAEER